MFHRLRSQFFVRIAGVAAALSILSSPARARAEEPELTRARVVELARLAPASRVAQFEAAVQGAAVTGAGVISLENPVVSGMGGVRFNPDGNKLASASATLSWPIDLVGLRGARVQAAQADHRAALLTVEDTQRRAVQGALLQHALVLRDEQQLQIAASRLELTQRLLVAAETRRKAGTVPLLDVTLMALQEQRDAAAEQGVKGTRDADKAALLTLLGKVAEDPPVTGDLVPVGDVPPLDELHQAVSRRTDVRAASAALDASRMRAANERTARWPLISVTLQYQREEGANTGLLGLSIPIPVLNANRAGVLMSAAEVGVADARHQAISIAASGEVKQRYARYRATRKALDLLAPSTALAVQAIELASRGYELGEADLASVLLVRREALDAQVALLDAKLAHASATIELLVSIGRMPQ